MNTVPKERINVKQPLVFRYNEDYNMTSYIEIRCDIIRKKEDFMTPHLFLYLGTDLSKKEIFCDFDEIDNMDVSLLPINEEKEKDEIPILGEAKVMQDKEDTWLELTLVNIDLYEKIKPDKGYSFIIRIDNIVLKEKAGAFDLRVKCHMGDGHMLAQTCRLQKVDFPKDPYSIINWLWISDETITVENDFYICFFNDQQGGDHSKLATNFRWYYGDDHDQICGNDDVKKIICSVAYVVGDDIKNYKIERKGSIKDSLGRAMSNFEVSTTKRSGKKPYLVVYHFEKVRSGGSVGKPPIWILLDEQGKNYFDIKINKKLPDIKELSVECVPDTIAVENEELQKFELHIEKNRIEFYDPEKEKEGKINIYIRYAYKNETGEYTEEKGALCTEDETEDIVCGIADSLQGGWKIRRKSPYLDTANHYIQFELIPFHGREPVEDAYYVTPSFSGFYSSVDIGEVEIIIEKENFRNCKNPSHITLHKKEGAHIKEFVSLPPAVLQGEEAELSWNITGSDQQVLQEDGQVDVPVKAIDSQRFVIEEDKDFELVVSRQPFEAIYRKIRVSLNSNWEVKDGIRNMVDTQNNFDNRFLYDGSCYQFSYDYGICSFDTNDFILNSKKFVEEPYLCHSLIETDEEIALAFVNSADPDVLHVYGDSIDTCKKVDNCQKILNIYRLVNNHFYAVCEYMEQLFLYEFMIEDKEIVGITVRKSDVNAAYSQEIIYKGDYYQFARDKEGNVQVKKDDKEIITFAGAKNTWFSLIHNDDHLYYVDELGVSTEKDFGLRMEGSCIPFLYREIPVIIVEDQIIKYLVKTKKNTCRWITKKLDV